MRIDVQTSQLALEPEQSAQIECLATSTLDSLREHISRVEVRLSDINGPIGGVDKRCRVVVHLVTGPAAVVEEFDMDLDDLIDRSLDRAGEAVHRRVRLGTLHCVDRRPQRSFTASIDARFEEPTPGGARKLPPHAQSRVQGAVCPRTAEMPAKLRTDEGQSTYRRHRGIAEPPSGWVNNALGFRKLSTHERAASRAPCGTSCSQR